MPGARDPYIGLFRDGYPRLCLDCMQTNVNRRGCRKNPEHRIRILYIMGCRVLLLFLHLNDLPGITWSGYMTMENYILFRNVMARLSADGFSTHRLSRYIEQFMNRPLDTKLTFNEVYKEVGSFRNLPRQRNPKMTTADFLERGRKNKVWGR